MRHRKIQNTVRFSLYSGLLVMLLCVASLSSQGQAQVGEYRLAYQLKSGNLPQESLIEKQGNRATVHIGKDYIALSTNGSIVKSQIWDIQGRQLYREAGNGQVYESQSRVQDSAFLSKEESEDTSSTTEGLLRLVFQQAETTYTFYYVANKERQEQEAVQAAAFPQGILASYWQTAAGLPVRVLIENAQLQVEATLLDQRQEVWNEAAIKQTLQRSIKPSH